MSIFNKIDDLEIIKRINNYDTIDLLSKVSCGSFFLKTSLFKSDKENMKHVMYNDSIIYLTALYITKGIVGGDRKIDYKELSQLVSDISYMVQTESTQLDEEGKSISMSQNTISEVLNRFKGYYINSLFRYQKDILADMNIDVEKFIDSLFHFLQNMFNINSAIEGKSFKEYINKFDFYNKSCFEYKGQYKEVLQNLSNRNGEKKGSYSKNNPVSSINKLRSCFLNIDDHLFCFDPNVITGKLPKYFSSIIPSNQINKWYENRKRWSEESVEYLFETYFPGAIILSNNFYGTAKHRKENDIIADFKGNLFIVEVKAENVTPDSVFENEEVVKESFAKQIKKGIEQCNDFYNTLKKDKSIDLLFEDNSRKNFVVDFNNYERIIKINVVFEEMGSYLPGFFIRTENTEENIIVNYYDLLTIFDYLENPVLIIKYLTERQKVIPKNCSVFDELIFLGLFTLEDIHFSDVINSTVEGIKEKDRKEVAVHFSPNEFMHEIEAYYSNPNSQKVVFNINKLIFKTLNVNYNRLTANELSHLIALLDMPIDVHDKLESSFKNINSNLVVRFTKYNDDREYAICIKPKRNDCLRICVKEFFSHKNLEEMVIIYFEGDKTKLTTIKRTSPELKKYHIGSW